MSESPHLPSPNPSAVRLKRGFAGMIVLAGISVASYFAFLDSKKDGALPNEESPNVRIQDISSTTGDLPIGAGIQKAKESIPVSVDKTNATGSPSQNVPALQPQSVTNSPDRSLAGSTGGKLQASSKKLVVTDGLPEGGIQMEPAKAKVVINGTPVEYEPNTIGYFPRTLIEMEGSAQIRIEYPTGTEGQPVVIQCLDGGVLDTGIVVKKTEVDAEKGVSFGFKAGVPEGIYRIALRRGFDQKTLEFWVGPEPTGKSVKGGS